jgi:hypothetical protein
MKEVKYLYTTDYKILPKEIKADAIKWKDIQNSCTGKVNTVRMFIFFPNM